MCLFIMLCGLPRLVLVAVRCAAVRRPANNSTAQAQDDDDRFSKLYLTLLNYNFKCFSLCLKYFLIINYECCSVKSVLFWRLAFIL